MILDENQNIIEEKHIDIDLVQRGDILKARTYLFTLDLRDDI